MEHLQQNNNNNLFIIIITFLLSFIVFLFSSISSHALAFDYNLNDQVFKDFRENNPGYIIWEDTTSGRLYLMGGAGLRQTGDNTYKPTLDYYNYKYTEDGKTFKSIGMPPSLVINAPNIKLIDANEPLKLDDGTVFFYRPLTGIMGDAIQTQAFQNVKVIAITGCLILSLMVSPILLKRLQNFL